MIQMATTFTYSALDDAGLGGPQGVDDADALIHLNTNSLLGHPAVRVLEDLQRRLGVAVSRRVAQMLTVLTLAVGAALEFGKFGNLVKLFQSGVLHRKHPCC